MKGRLFLSLVLAAYSSILSAGHASQAPAANDQIRFEAVWLVSSQGSLVDNLQRLLPKLAVVAGLPSGGAVVLDDSTLAEMNTGQNELVLAAFREKRPILLLTSAPGKIAELRRLLGIEADQQSAHTGSVLEAYGIQAAPGIGVHEAFFSFLPDGIDTEERQEQRALVMCGWLEEAQRRQEVTLPEVKDEGKKPLEQAMSALVRQASLTWGQATTIVRVEAWGAHSFTNKNDYYLLRVRTTFGAGNYRIVSAHPISCPVFKCDEFDFEQSKENCKGQSQGVCQRGGYLRTVSSLLTPPNAEGLHLVEAKPHSEQFKHKYTVSSGWSLSGKISTGWESNGTEIGSGVMYGTTQEVTIQDAVMVGQTGIGHPKRAGWKLEMPSVRTGTLSSDPYAASDHYNLLVDPFPIQRGSGSYDSLVIYEITPSYRAQLEAQGKGFEFDIGIHWVEESAWLFRAWSELWTRNKQTNLKVFGGCNLFGNNCEPSVIYQYGPDAKSWPVSLPLVANKVAVKPTLSKAVPSEGTAGATITLQGSGLSGASKVLFGAEPATSFHVDNDNQITAVAPKGSGTVKITVQTPAGISNDIAFSYVGSAPPSTRSSASSRIDSPDSGVLACLASQKM